MDHFSCPICLDATKNGLLCPKCYKPFCADCIARYFVSTRTTGASGCPYCKEDVRFKDFFKMGWLNDLQDEVAVMKKRDADPCTSHPDNHLDMFCTACKVVCCFTCSNEDHNDHPMEPIRKAHQKVKKSWENLQISLTSTEEIEAAYQKISQKIKDVQEEGNRRIKTITEVRSDASFGQKAFDLIESCINLTWSCLQNQTLFWKQWGGVLTTSRTKVEEKALSITVWWEAMESIYWSCIIDFTLCHSGDDGSLRGNHSRSKNQAVCSFRTIFQLHSNRTWTQGYYSR